MPFDENIGADVQDVLNAAAILDITEYDLFRLAYARWHGAVADAATMEAHYVGYMFREIVPLWVRHFARLVIRRRDQGTLDRAALGVERLPQTRQMVRRGTRYGVAIVTAVAVLVVIAEFAAKVLGLSERCMFPPCY